MNRSRLISFFLIFTFIAEAFAENNFDTEDKKIAADFQAADTQSINPNWEFNPPPGHLKQTEVVAFVIQGRIITDRIYAPDFDIVISKDNFRLIPLLRLLRLMEATGNIYDDSIVFKFEDNPVAAVDIKNKALRVENETYPIEIETGISDITGKGEFYVSENILKFAFGFDFSWSDEKYAYQIKVDKNLHIFEKNRLKSKSLFTADVNQIIETLPETEPPAYPQKRKRLVSFLQTELRTDFLKRWQSNQADYYRVSAYPALNVWGRFLSGDYNIRLRENIDYPDTRLSKFSGLIEHALWTSKNDELLMRIGDTNLGLNDLVAPAVNLLGLSFKWLPKSETEHEKKIRDRFFTNYKPNFLSLGKFDGYAPLGAAVELWINNRLIISKIIDEKDNQKQGYGYYKFDGIGLLDNYINEIKIIVKRPDGITEEFHKEILGAGQLLPKGQSALSGGGGTHRQKINGEIAAKGEFAGLQFLYGLSENLTVGLTTAMQNKFAILNDQDDTAYYSPRKYYLAQEARYKLFENFLTKGNTAISLDSTTNSSSFAASADFEYYLRSSRLKAQLFSYAPKYSNGIMSISDKRGYALSAIKKIFNDWQARSGFLHIRNNLNGKSTRTQKEDFLLASLMIPSFLPNTAAQIQAGHSEHIDSSGKELSGNIYTFKMNNRLTKELEIENEYTFGDKRLDITSSKDLKFGIPLQDITFFYAYGIRSSLNYRLNNLHTLSAAYWKSRNNKKIEIASQYNYSGRYNWHSRFIAGNDLTTGKYYFKEYFDFDLDKRGDYRWGIKTEMDQSRKNYEIGLYITLRDLFFINDEGRINHIVTRGIKPERGGIEGLVYLDLDGDGHRGASEPGVQGIKILSDGTPAGESGADGRFLIARREQKDFVTLSLDSKSLSAIYIPTQGVQKAYSAESSFTCVNLGVCVVGSISGTVKVKTDTQELTNLAGAKVLLLLEDQKTIAQDSITAYDGSFYLGQIKPGTYFTTVDKDSLGSSYELNEPPKKLTIFSGQNPHEIENYEIFLKTNTVKERISKYAGKIGEEIIYDIKLGRLNLGKAIFKHLADTEFNEKQVNCMAFEKSFAFLRYFTEIYSDPENFLPVKIQQKLRGWIFDRTITEYYNQEEFTLNREKIAKNKKENNIIQCGGQIQNELLLPFHLRNYIEYKNDFKIKTYLPQESVVKLVSIEDITVPAGKFKACHFISEPKKVEIWISADKHKVPLKIKTKYLTMNMKEYRLK